ncbi:patatin-like phospholipase family protein [Allostreptomyces psammosilenae]|uniref:NTE family protein n=1 Tax=Allostreptomyces psammosilenae TaxID=1892865 RepID=A0A853A273_9ACTN|nr:patatin-like phospholipase family protein [Allostreptomyces psammosilenae]NYI04871.1 NTE family protein [Allostreptomyces psammosilenae]
MTTAWVLPGGGSYGAVQAGQARALMEAGIFPDMVLGTSVGSLNAAWLAGDPTREGVERLRRMWLEIRRTQAFPVDPLRMLGGVLRLRNHVMDNAPLGRWLSSRVSFHNLEDGRLPLTVTAVDVLTGDPVYLDRGPLIPALLASSALPGIFPPVEIDGRWLIDGGLAAHTPVTRAVDQGADRVFVLPSSGTQPFSLTPEARGLTEPHGRPSPSPSEPPHTPASVRAAALGAAIDTTVRLELELGAQRCELYVLPAPNLAGLSSFSFRHARQLMNAGLALGRRWIAEGAPRVGPGPVAVDGAPALR